MRVEWSERANFDIGEIAAYKLRSNSDEAFRWTNAVYGLARDLETFPEMGRIIPELDNPRLCELVFESRYRVMYRLTGEEIQILTVRDGRQYFDAETLFEP